jgi:hypothetical protein
MDKVCWLPKAGKMLQCFRVKNVKIDVIAQDHRQAPLFINAYANQAGPQSSAAPSNLVELSMLW